MLRALTVLALLGAAPALAETRPPSAAQQAQQEKMRRCNADARAQNLTGERRQGFMRDCLRATSRQ